MRARFGNQYRILLRRSQVMRNKMQCAAACGTRPLWHLRFISWCENNSTRRRAVRNLNARTRTWSFTKESSGRCRFHPTRSPWRWVQNRSLYSHVVSEAVYMSICCHSSDWWDRNRSIFCMTDSYFRASWSTSSLTRIREEPQFPSPGFYGFLYFATRNFRTTPVGHEYLGYFIWTGVRPQFDLRNPNFYRQINGFITV